MACISGANGAGKSSLLDAITWVLFGKARRTDDSIINSSRAVKAAEVVFDFRYEDNLYRVQRSKPREKTTLLEFSIQDDGGAWRALTEHSVRETEARIRAILRMDFDTFTNASFLLQGRADQFAQQAPGERKKVLSAILGLEVWEGYRSTAAERRKGLEIDLKSIEAQLEEINAELDQETDRRQRLAEKETNLETLSKLRKALEETLASMRRLAATLDEQRRLVDVLDKAVVEQRQRHERQSAELNGLREERERHRQVLASEAEVKARYQRWQDLRAELERRDAAALNFREIEAKRSGPLSVIAAEAARLDAERSTLALQQAAVQADQERLPGLEVQLKDSAAQVQECESQLAGRAALEEALRDFQAQASDARSENTRLKEAMNVLKERIDPP